MQKSANWIPRGTELLSVFIIVPLTLSMLDTVYIYKGKLTRVPNYPRSYHDIKAEVLL